MINPTLTGQVQYDPHKSFELVSPMSFTPFILHVRALHGRRAVLISPSTRSRKCVVQADPKEYHCTVLTKETTS